MSTTAIAGLAALTTIGLAVFGAGLYVASIGAGRIRTARRLAEDGATPLGEVSDARGLVTVEGTARVGDEGTLEAPLSGRDCLAYAIAARTRAVDSRDRGGTETDDVGTGVVDRERTARIPFAVTNGTGRVTIDPANAVLTLSTWQTSGADWQDLDDLHPDAVKRLETAGVVDGLAVESRATERNDDSRHQFAERRLEPGDEVTVFGGTVVEPPDRVAGHGAAATVGGDDWFEISIGDESTVAPDRRRSGSLYLIFGGLIALPGAGFGLAGIVGLVSTLLL